MSIAIKAENISKKYILGEIGTGTISHDINRWFKRAMGKEDPYAKIGTTSFSPKKGENFSWALNNINFELNTGDVLGVIGRNGAGKSTLLKILSKVTKPTTGNIKIYGRTASLLEVGTGFHPELTGRENIFLNGAILGMKKEEIKQKLDEIIDFSGVEKYIDTPVKRYSSGMYVRLAFAVAAHLEPEILIIDEVLAVGDAEFQKKCLGKMKNVAQGGRTVLFVSHNMNAVRNLCNKGIVINNGTIKFDGDINEAIDQYQSTDSILNKKINLINSIRKNTSNQLIFSEFEFENFPIKMGESIKFFIRLQNNDAIITTYKNLEFGIAIIDKNTNYIVHCSNKFINKEFIHSDDKCKYNFEIENILRPGIYYLTLFLRINGIVQDWLPESIQFEIEDGNPYRYNNTSEIQGMILPNFDIYQS